MSEQILTIKVGRIFYNITTDDVFLDNGACVQLITQKGPLKDWRHTSPVLPLREVKRISAFTKIQRKHNYDNSCSVFSLTKRGEG